MQYHLRTLGHLSLHPGTPGSDAVLRDSKSLAVLAYVATAPGRKARRSHLADLLWPSSDSTRARRSLRQALYYLSQKADDGLVLSDDGVLGVDSGRLTVDLWRFDRALEDGDWERAVELYDGPFLDGFDVRDGREFEGWLEAQNERVWSGLKAAYYRLVREAVEADDVHRAVRHARDYVELNPLDEKAQRTLVRTHLSAGDRVGAYRAYERYRALLKEELGAEPGPELEARVGELRDRLFAEPGEAPAEGGDPAGGRGDAAEGPEAGEASGPPSPPARAGATAPGTETGRGGLSGVRVGLVARWLGVGVAAGLAFGFVLWSMTLGSGPGPPAGHTWEGATGRLAAPVEGGRELVLDVRNGRVEASRSRPRRPAVAPSPDGARTLLRVPTAGGTDVVAVGAAGDTAPVATSGADEGIFGWSPGGRRALLWRGQPTEENRAFDRRLLILDASSGRIRPLDTPALGRPYQAAWSPLGPHVAFRAEADSGRGDIFRVDVDGTDLVELTRHPAEDRDPAWSTDGRRIAFVSTRAGDRDLHVIDAQGGEPERVTHGPASDGSPVWLSPLHLAFVSDRDGPRDVWLMDLQTRRVRRLTRRGGLRGLRALEVPGRGPPVEGLRVVSVPRVVSPGQHLSLTARLRDAEGGSVPPELASVSWSTPDGSVLRLEPGGRGRVVGVGEARVVGSAGGWVSDTLRLVSRPLGRRSASLVMSEDWSDGLRPDRWVAFGSPAPYVAPPRDPAGPAANPGDAETGAATASSAGAGSAAAPGGADADAATASRARTPAEPRPPRRVFVNNGDANYASGVAGRRALALDEGLSVEFRARLPFTGAMYQTLKVGLAPGTPERGAPFWRGMKKGLLLVLGGQDRSAHRLTGPDGANLRIPALPDPGAWHTYTLQVGPRGRASLCVDGHMWWSGARPVARSLAGGDVHLVVAGRTAETRLEVGRVRVWQGVRLAPEGERPAPLARGASPPGG